MNEPTKTCPLGHECYRCLWLVTLRGQNPQTGEEVDRRECALTAIPLLLVENAQQGRQTAASVESFRNEMVRGNNAFLGMLQYRQNEEEMMANQMRLSG